LKGKIEMKFSYQNLKMAELGGDRVGNWKGLPVFASRRVLVDDKAGGAFFIVYDDDNVIVKRDNGVWYCYGQVSVEGSVEECDKRRYNVYAESVVYCHDTQTYEPAAHAVCGKNDAECDGTAAAAADEVVGDVKLGLDIDALLSSVRTMTIDSLLEGFNYGLDAKG
jgi:hypothetical protein